MKFLQNFPHCGFSRFFFERIHDFWVQYFRICFYYKQNVSAIFPARGGGMPLEVMASSGEIVALDVVVAICAAVFCFVERIGLLESWRNHLRHREFRFPNRCMSGWRSFAGACGV
jgi:hypothetical protein